MPVPIKSDQFDMPVAIKSDQFDRKKLATVYNMYSLTWSQFELAPNRLIYLMVLVRQYTRASK